MLLFFIAVGACAATLLGGYLALRLRDKLHLILGFSAGAVVAVAFFDLLPEALELSNASTALVWVAGGFFAYLVLDRLFLVHAHAHDEPGHGRGASGAGTLSLHSFVDGVAVGLGFQASPAVGVVVAAAVLAHDFSDGINTVNFILKSGGSMATARRWLLADALAPVLGIAATLFFAVPEGALGLLLSLFAGFFLYIGASDLMPESHHTHPTFWTTFMTLAGAVCLFVVIKAVTL